MSVTHLQRRHFRRMTRTELKEAILDFEKQISYIALSDTDAGEAKRNELQERIDYCNLLLKVKK